MIAQLTKKAASSLVVVSLLACPFTVSITTAAPNQGALPVSSLASGTSVKLANNTSMLARHSNNTPKVTESPAAPAREVKQHDPKAVARCWKRLMTMVREVRQAHHTKK